jgi:acyl-coenzyme A thioesterase PaaI-like protein
MHRATAYLSSVLSRNPSRPFYEKLLLEKLCLKSVNLSNSTSKVLISLPLLPDWLNSGGTLHGGFLATVIDESTCLSAAILDDRYTVSTDLSVSYINAVQKTDTIEIEAVCNLLEKNLAHATALIKVKENIVASGRHTLFLLNSKWNE